MKGGFVAMWGWKCAGAANDLGSRANRLRSFPKGLRSGENKLGSFLNELHSFPNQL
jgi:hypothetical protein